MTKDLTQGKITPLLVKFTIPLLFGNIFQLMYNSVDSIIVGQLVGKEALAAVGTSNPLMTLAILFVNGMCIGASILMGTQYGAKKMDVLKRQISNCVLHYGHVVLHSFCQTVIITDSGAGGSASACSFLSENRVFGIYFYIYL